MLQYKLDVLHALKVAGFSTYRLRKEKILGEATIQKLRKQELISWDSINTVCRLLDAQPGDLLQYKGDSE